MFEREKLMFEPANRQLAGVPNTTIHHNHFDASGSFLNFNF